MSFEETSVSASSETDAIKAFVYNLLSSFLLIVFIFALIYGILAVPLFIFLGLPVAALSLLFKYFSLKVNVSFDYSVGGGSLKIGKVVNNRKRKELFEFFSQDIKEVTVTDDIFRRESNKKTVICSASDVAPEGKSFISIETDVSYVIIEATDKLFAAIKGRSFY